MSVIEDLQNTVDRLSAARTGIQNAIKAKGVSVANDDGFEDFETKIRSIAQLDTSDANATAADIVSGKSAYVKGAKVNGSLSFATVYSGSSAPASSLGSNGDFYIQL